MSSVVASGQTLVPTIPDAANDCRQVFTMSDGRILVLYGSPLVYETSTDGVTWSTAASVPAISGTLHSVVQHGDTLYALTISSFTLSVTVLSYASATLTGAAHTLGTGPGGAIADADACWDATYSVLHCTIAAGVTGYIGAWNPASPTVQPTWTRVQQGANTFVPRGLLCYAGGGATTILSVHEFFTGGTGTLSVVPMTYNGTYSIGGPETPAIGAVDTAACSLDAGNVLDIVTVRSGSLSAIRRTGTGTYASIIPLVSGGVSGPLTLVANSTDLVVFFRSITNRSTGDIYAVWRQSGSWGTPSIIAGGDASGYATPKTAAGLTAGRYDLVYQRGSDIDYGAGVQTAAPTAPTITVSHLTSLTPTFAGPSVNTGAPGDAQGGRELHVTRNSDSTVLWDSGMLPAQTSTVYGAGGTSTGGTLQVGVWQPNVPTDFTGLDTFESDAGRHQDIVMFWRDWQGASSTIDPAWLTTIDGRGSIPMITWSPTDWDTGVALSLTAIASGTYDTYIQGIADTLAAFGKPVYLRTMHEFNGNWYPSWSGNPTTYIAAWQHIHDVFVARGATNVQWVWCPNVWWIGSLAVDPTPYYPGDTYVDWLGLDGYNNTSQGWSTFGQLFSYATTHIQTIAGSKPIMIAEFASGEPTSAQATAGDSKATWITDAYAQIATMPKITAALWFNEDKTGTEGAGTDWPIETSTGAQGAFRTAMSGLAGTGGDPNYVAPATLAYDVPYTVTARDADSSTPALVGPWSSGVSFTLVQGGTVTITQLVDGGVTSASSPATIGAATIDSITASVTQPQSHSFSQVQDTLYDSVGVAVIAQTPATTIPGGLASGSSYTSGSWPASGLANGSTYLLVRSYLDSVTGLWSDSPPWTITTSWAPPPAPSNLTVLWVEHPGYTYATWTNPPEAVSVTLERSLAGANDWVTVSSGSLITQASEMTPLEMSTGWDWRVSIVDARGIQSDHATVTGVLATPDGIFGAVLVDAANPAVWVHFGPVGDWKQASTWDHPSDIQQVSPFGATLPTISRRYTENSESKQREFVVPPDGPYFAGGEDFSQDAAMATFIAMGNAGNPVWYRDVNRPSGRYVQIMNVQESIAQDGSPMQRLQWDMVEVAGPGGPAAPAMPFVLPGASGPPLSPDNSTPGNFIPGTSWPGG